jgi:ribonuclease P protein component
MKKTDTIKENRTFRRIYNKGRSAVTPYLVLYCRPNGCKQNRLGVTVSTKLGCAVVRNRARRRLREVYRLAQPDMKQGYDIILVARTRAVNGPYPKLTAAFYKACGQLGLAVGDKT